VVHYPLPLNRQPAVADPAAHLPHGDKAAQEVLSLPMHPYLDQHTTYRVINSVLDAMGT
jgi:UDP-2-acetamido-2-deoxy-ribo-hexuluronate aminotransferase